MIGNFGLSLIFALGLPQQAVLGDILAKVQQGIQALQNGQYAVAEKSFEEVLKVDPRSATAYCNLGVVYAKTDRLDAAIGAFELTPNVAGINLNLVLIFYRKEQFAKAAEEFDHRIATRLRDWLQRRRTPDGTD